MCAEIVEILTPYHAHAGLALQSHRPYTTGRRYRWDIRATFEGCCEDAAIDLVDVTFHTLRHTFASAAAQQGVSLYKIASWMGHGMVDVTELYAHLCAYDEDINRLNPQAQPPSHRPNLRIVK